MFKGFQNTSKTNGFNGFPALNFQMNNEAYGFSGCTFWLDAAYGLNTQTDLAAVSSWQSRIGGITFTQATAGNQPRYKVTDASFNNLPTVQFYDNARYMISTLGLAPIGQYTIACVAKVSYGLAQSENVIFGNQVSFSNSFFYGGGGATPITGIGIRQGGTFYQTTTEDSNTHIVIYSGSEGIFIDGSLVRSGILPGFTEVLNQIGRGWNTNVNAGLCDIAEILIFNYSLSNSQSGQLSARINSKYAIY